VDVTSLEPLALPTDDWHGWLANRVDTLLQATSQTLDDLKDGTSRSTAEVLDMWNDADISLRAADSITSVLSEVHPDEAVRTLAEQRAQDVDRLRTDRGLDRDLFDVLDATDPAGLTSRPTGSASTCCATSGAAASTATTRSATGSARSPSG
jgi:thimet oligopeptidase